MKKSASGRPALRILTAVPICDGHDSAINTINMELVRAGVEVIYLGYHRSSRDIVRAAIQEDVAAIGISSYNGGHVEFFGEVCSLLDERGAGDIGVFGGGGGTITAADAKAMTRGGVDRIFFAAFVDLDHLAIRRESLVHLLLGLEVGSLLLQLEDVGHPGKLPAEPAM